MKRLQKNNFLKNQKIRKLYILKAIYLILDENKNSLLFLDQFYSKTSI